ncbi:MAG: mechanosensitive ion channel family protein [Candidatus Diapherotrites archaeon]|nr:mechanosensitive ion channel family protein [Candidatus Diapherotrites archaeon]
MLETVILGNTVMQYIEVIGIAIGSLLAAKVLYFLFKNVIGAAVAKTETKLDDELVDKAEEPLVLLVVLAGLYFGITRLSLDSGLMWVNNGTYLIVVAVLTWLALRLADVAVKFWLKPLAKKSKSKVDDQLVPIADKVLKLVILTFATIMVLSHFGYNVDALIAGLGVGGIAVALATKDYLENIIGGLTIFTDKPFRIGDRIKVGEVEGTVKEVGIRSTRIMTFDNTLVIIPNSQMVTSKLVNVSEPNRTIAVKMTLGLVYSTTVDQMEKAKKIIKKAILKNDEIDEKYEPLIFFSEFGDSALKLWVKYRIKDYSNKLTITDKINMEIKREFEKAKIDFAYPTQTVYVKK